MKFLLLFLLGLTQCSLLSGYSMGAPDAACSDLTPGHQHQPRASLPPVNLTVSQPIVKPGEMIDLELTSLGNITFMGFIMQAREAENKIRQIGSFIAGDDAKYMTCGRGIHNSLTHRSPEQKTSVKVQWRAPSDFEGEVVFKFTCLRDYSTFWVGVETAPVLVTDSTTTETTSTTTETTTTTTTTQEPVNEDPINDVENLIETDYSEKEVDPGNNIIEDDPIDDEQPVASLKLEPVLAAKETENKIDLADVVTPLYISSTTTIRTPSTTESTPPPLDTYEGIQRFTAPDDEIFEGCNETKSCFGIPPNCVKDGKCQVVVAYWPDRLKYKFQMKGLSSGYLSFGLSRDNKMGGDLTTNCVLRDNGNVDIVSGFNYGKRGNRPLDKSDLKDDGISERSESGRRDGWIYCSWSRIKSFVTNNEVWAFNKDKYFVMLAEGQMEEAQPQYHNQKLISDFSVGLGEVVVVKPKNNLYIILHGSFMIGAWICSASIGIIMARYYKSTWTGSKMWGLDQWFIWHRTFMMLAWALTIVGFVLILVELQEVTKTIFFNPHAIIGFITVGLSFLQPFIALLRCDPMHRFRWVFNWVHWLIGNVAQILGVVAIFFAVDLEKAQLPRPETDWLLIGFVAFHFLTHIVMSIINCITEFRHSKSGSYPVPMRAMGYHSGFHGYPDYEELKRDAPGVGLRIFTLVLYIIINVLVTAALILLVALAPTRNVLEEMGILQSA